MGKLEVFNHLHGYFQTNPDSYQNPYASWCWYVLVYYIVYSLHIGNVYHCWINMW